MINHRKMGEFKDGYVAVNDYEVQGENETNGQNIFQQVMDIAERFA